MYPISHYRLGDGKMTRQELENTYIVNEHGTFAPRFELSITKQEIDGEVVIIEDYTITATSEEVYQEHLTPPKLPGDKMEVLEGKVMALEESQVGQDFIIDDLIFEVIPMLEQQINVNNTQPVQLASVISNKLIKGESAMAAYLAKKIMDGRDYQAVFRTYSYKMYQDEVDTILELEGRGDLIKR